MLNSWLPYPQLATMSETMVNMAPVIQTELQHKAYFGTAAAPVTKPFFQLSHNWRSPSGNIRMEITPLPR